MVVAFPALLPIDIENPHHYWNIVYQPEQLEHRRPMITHTIEQFILDSKLILLTSSHWIQAHTVEQFILDPKSKQDKVKVTNLKNFPKLQIF